MAQMIDHDASAVIHYGPPKAGTDFISRLTNGIGNELSEALTVKGIGVGITRGLGSYSLDGTVDLWVPNGNVDSQLNDVAVIRDIAGGFSDPANEVVAMVDQLVPILNGPKVRRGDNKQYITDIKLYGDKQPNTVFVESLPGDTKEIEGMFSHLGGVVYAKPTKGAAAKGVFRLDRASDTYRDTILTLAEQGAGRPYLLQAEIRNRHPLPSGIKPLDETEGEKLKAYIDQPKELRIFWFYGAGHNLDWLPILRVKPLMEKVAESTGKEEYIAIDPDTTPVELVDFTKAVLDRFSSIVGASEMSGAMDFAYGASGDDTEPTWWVMEGNYWQPVPPSRNEHPDLRKEFVRATTDQMVRIARNRSKK